MEETSNDEPDETERRTRVERSTREPRPGMLGDIADETIREAIIRRAAMEEAQKERIRESGGPQAYVQKVAPSFCSLFNGTITEEMAVEHPEPLWQEINDRAAQCLGCPETGGTCANSFHEGERLAITGKSVDFVPCSRWKEYRLREKLRRAGVPPELVGVGFRDLFDRTPVGDYQLRDDFLAWYGKVVRREATPSLILTGGKTSVRTMFLAAITRQVASHGVRVGYTFGPKLASELRRYYDKSEGEESPLAELEALDVLAFDYLDPKPLSREPWAPWFVERVDQLLWSRVGAQKVTVMCSRMRASELMTHFEYTATFPIAELQLDDPRFGPLFV